jgi:hypothetical protein
LISAHYAGVLDEERVINRGTSAARFNPQAGRVKIELILSAADSAVQMCADQRVCRLAKNVGRAGNALLRIDIILEIIHTVVNNLADRPIRTL